MDETLSPSVFSEHVEHGKDTTHSRTTAPRSCSRRNTYQPYVAVSSHAWGGVEPRGEPKRARVGACQVHGWLAGTRQQQLLRGGFRRADEVFVERERATRRRRRQCGDAKGGTAHGVGSRYRPLPCPIPAPPQRPTRRRLVPDGQRRRPRRDSLLCLSVCPSVASSPTALRSGKIRGGQIGLVTATRAATHPID